MTSNGVVSGKTGDFYGWFALAGAMLVIFVVGGAFVYSYGVFLPVICQEYGWSRASVGAGLSIGFLTFGLPSPLYGAMVARFGPRINIILGNMVVGLGMMAMYLVQEVWHIYLIYGLVGLGGGIGGYIAGSAIANNWFIKKRSLALGMFTGCGGLGGFVFAPLTSALMASIGWRLSWVVLGVIVLVGACLIGGWLIRNRPEDMGQLPDGMTAGPFVAAEIAEAIPGDTAPVRWRARQILQIPTTWFLGGFSAAAAYAMGTMSAHQVAYIEDLGFAPITAAMTMSVIAVSGVLGSLGFGILALRLNIRYLVSASFVIKLLALGILLTTRNLTLIYIYAVLFGISHAAQNTALPTFIGAYYEREHYAQVLGIIFPCQVVTQALGATIAGAIYDATTMYTMAFVVVVAISLGGLVCAFLARRPALPPPDDSRLPVR